MSWEDQGRQFHSWFGHGTAGAGAGQDAASVVAGVAASRLVGARQGEFERYLERGGVSELRRALPVWAAQAELGTREFRRAVVGPALNAEAAALLQRSAQSYAAGDTAAAGRLLGDAVAAAGPEWRFGLRFAHDTGVDISTGFGRLELGNASGTIGAAGFAPEAVNQRQQFAQLQLAAPILRKFAPDIAKAIIAGLAVILGVESAKQDATVASDQPVTSPDPAPAGADQGSQAEPTGAVVTEGARTHILDGDVAGGGHGVGRNQPGKSEFPPGWGDDRVIEAVRDVVNDPSSARKPGRDGTIRVSGTRDGVKIEVVVEADGKTVITAYPTNVKRNPK